MSNNFDQQTFCEHHLIEKRKKMGNPNIIILKTQNNALKFERVVPMAHFMFSQNEKFYKMCTQTKFVTLDT